MKSTVFSASFTLLIGVILANQQCSQLREAERRVDELEAKAWSADHVPCCPKIGKSDDAPFNQYYGASGSSQCRMCGDE